MIALLRRTDWILWLAVVVILGAGLLTLSSSATDLFFKQSIYAGIGTIIAFIIIRTELRPLISYRWLIVGFFLLSVFFLALVPIFGTEVAGNKSWINLGITNFQPSEFAKLALIVVLAAFFSRRHQSIRRLGVIASSFLYFIIPGALILAEPDMGSALIFFGIWFGFLVVAGLPWRYLAIAAAIFAVMGVLAWNFAFKDYQRNRIMAVFNPESDPLGVNYNVIQSKNAIGSAGFFGKGYAQGAVVRLGFLPAAQTDFIFASFVEEWGLAGALVVIFAFCVLIWRMAVIGMAADGNFYKFACLGSIVFFVMHFAVNMGSAIGFFPVVGIVLPFMSYGGSNLLTSFALIGIIQNIASRTVS
jgi:rod shape determining protein RodA